MKLEITEERAKIQGAYCKALILGKEFDDIYHMVNENIADIPGILTINSYDAYSYPVLNECTDFVYEMILPYLSKEQIEEANRIKIAFQVFDSLKIKELENPENLSLAEYTSSHKNIPKHIGIVHNGAVISKFKNGYTFYHGINSVPVSYGDEVKFYRWTENPPLKLNLQIGGMIHFAKQNRHSRKHSLNML